MIFIVTRGNVFCRAFLSEQDAIKYRDTKIMLNHDHCCICDANCIYRDTRCEHTPSYRIPTWDIIEYPTDIHFDDVIFIVCEKNDIKRVSSIYENCKPNEFETVKVCKFSETCLYSDGKEIDEYKDDSILHQLKHE